MTLDTLKDIFFETCKATENDIEHYVGQVCDTMEQMLANDYDLSPDDIQTINEHWDEWVAEYEQQTECDIQGDNIHLNFQPPASLIINGDFELRITQDENGSYNIDCYKHQTPEQLDDDGHDFDEDYVDSIYFNAQKYILEFSVLTPNGKHIFIKKCYADTPETVDKLIQDGKKEHKKFLQTNDNLSVCIKDIQGNVLDNYTFEPQELTD